MRRLPRQNRRDAKSQNIRERVIEQTAQLTRNYTVKTQYYMWSRHRNKVKRYYYIECQSLIAQLMYGAKAATKPDIGRHIKNNESRVPPMEHLDLVNWIAKDAEQLLASYGRDADPSITRRVIQSASLMVGIPDCASKDRCDIELCDLHLISAHIRSWYVSALVTLGWWDAARDLKTECPYCGKKKLIARTNPLVAWCVNCHEAWDENNIGVLAEYVRNLK
jgi:hypothetical protein